MLRNAYHTPFWCVFTFAQPGPYCWARQWNRQSYCDRRDAQCILFDHLLLSPGMILWWDGLPNSDSYRCPRRKGECRPRWENPLSRTHNVFHHATCLPISLIQLLPLGEERLISPYKGMGFERGNVYAGVPKLNMNEHRILLISSRFNSQHLVPTNSRAFHPILSNLVL